MYDIIFSDFEITQGYHDQLASIDVDAGVVSEKTINALNEKGIDYSHNLQGGIHFELPLEGLTTDERVAEVRELLY